MKIYGVKIQPKKFNQNKLINKRETHLFLLDFRHLTLVLIDHHLLCKRVDEFLTQNIRDAGLATKNAWTFEIILENQLL